MVTISSGIVVIDGKRINGSDGPVKHLNKNLKTDLIILGVLAAGISLIPVCAGAAIAAKVFLCSWWGSFAIGAGAGAVAGAGIGTGASFIASSITGVEVTSLLGKYIFICAASGIFGAIVGGVNFQIPTKKISFINEKTDYWEGWDYHNTVTPNHYK